MVFFYNSLITQFLLNGYYIFRINKKKKLPKGLKITLYVIILLEFLVYLSGLLFREQLDTPIYGMIHKINAFWVVSGLYFLVLLFLFDLIFYLNKKWVFKVKLKEKSLFIIEALLTIGAFWTVYYHIHISGDNYAEPTAREFTFDFPAPTAEADSLQLPTSYKIVVISDLHLGYIINRKVLEQYIKVVNKQEPDIVVIVGDLIDYYLDPLIEEGMDVELMNFRASKGVFFIPGNHEYKTDITENLEWIKKAGITVLRDSVAGIDDQLFLIGWDDRKNEENRMPLNELLTHTPALASSILFVHQPKDFEEAFKHNIPLSVAGHTHRGQLFPGNALSILQNNFYGMNEDPEGSSAYTTSGIGMTGMPIKTSGYSEIVIFRINIHPGENV